MVFNKIIVNILKIFLVIMKISNVYYRETALLPNVKDHLKSAVLQLNGQDRFEKRDAHYFRNVQRYQHHSGSSILVL